MTQTYTINGKQYTEFDIKLRCSELMQIKVLAGQDELREKLFHIVGYCEKGGFRLGKPYNPCNNWSDVGPIIEKIWGELMSDFPLTKWEQIIEKHKCTQLVAACICLIELNA